MKRVKVPSTFKKPVTANHLLTHSSRFDELEGRRVLDETKKITLDTFLSNRLVRLREPGKVSSYSSYGIALAGLIIEDVSNLSYEKYLKDNIWKSTNMTMTSIVIPEHQKNTYR